MYSLNYTRQFLIDDHMRVEDVVDLLGGDDNGGPHLLVPLDVREAQQGGVLDTAARNIRLHHVHVLRNPGLHLLLGRVVGQYSNLKQSLQQMNLE